MACIALPEHNTEFLFHDFMISLRVFDVCAGSQVAGGTIPGDSPRTELADSPGPYVRSPAHRQSHEFMIALRVFNGPGLGDHRVPLRSPWWPAHAALDLGIS